MQPDLRGSLEENVLTLLVWDDSNATTVALSVRPDLFSTKAYREIAAAATAYLDRFGRAPKNHIADLLENTIRKADGGHLILDIIWHMEKLHPTLHVEYVLSELERFVTLRTMAMALEDAVEAVHAGDIERAYEALNQQIKPVNYSPGIWMHDPDAVLSFLDHTEEDRFSSGVEVLDRRNVVPQRKTMTLLVAPTKRGKSWYLVNVGKANMMIGRSVLHITLEMSEQQTAKRYVQALFGLTQEHSARVRIPIIRRDNDKDDGNFLGIDFDTIQTEKLDADMRTKIANKLRALKNRKPILIKEFPTGSLTVSQLKNYLEMLKRTSSYVPDVLLVDYPDLMAIDSKDRRGSLGNTFVQLRGIAVANNMALVTVTQSNRDSDNANVVGISMVSEDWSKIATADTVLTFNRTDAEEKRGLARLYAAALRGQQGNFFVLITQSYMTGQFCLDSVYFDNAVKEEASNAGID